jgi:hypothetical protein
MTAYALDEDRYRAMKVGCNTFASKPIGFTYLLTTISRLIPRMGA